MSIDKFTQQIESVHGRMLALHKQIDGPSPQHSELLTDAFAELDNALEELQASEEELHQQYEELLATRQALEVERQRYQDLFDLAPDGYLVTDPRGIIQEANRTAATLLNLSQQFLVGKPLALFIAAEERQAFRSGLSQLRQVEQRQAWEVRLQPHKGEAIDAVLTVAAVHDPTGKTVALRWLLRDITERKRAAEELRGSEAKLRLITEQIPAHVWTTDTDLRVTSVMGGALSELGLDPNQYIGKTLYELLETRDFDSAAIIAAYLQALQGEPAGYEINVLGRHFEARVEPLRDAQGQIIGCLGLALDVTERKQAEETIRSLLYISEKLNATLDLDVLLDTIVQEAIKLTNAESGCVGLRTPEGMVCQKYFQKSTILPLDYCWPPGHGLPGWLLVHKVPYLTNDALNDQQIVHELCVQFGVRSALSTPILDSQGEVIGFFEIHNKKADSGFTQSDQDLLMAVSHSAAIAIQNALAYQELKQAEEALRSAHDELEIRVAERTAELVNINAALQAEITERKRVEVELRQSEERFRLLFEHSPDGIILTDPHHPSGVWPIVACNDAACLMNGYTREELIGQSIDLLHPEYRDPEAYAACLDWLRREGTLQLETVHRRKDGTLFPIETSISLVTLSGQEFILGIDRDITERKRMEETLYATNQMLRAVIQASPLAIIALDVPGNVTLWNPAAERIFGWSKHEVLGHPNPIVPEDKWDEFQAKHARTLQGATFTELELQRQRKDGSLIHVSVSSAPLQAINGTIQGSMGVIADITERKRMERELAWREALMRSMASAAPLGLLLVDNCTDAILYFNHRFCEIWGIEHLEERMQRGELKNNHIVPNCLPLVRDVPAFVESCKPLQSEENCAIVEDEIRLVDGRTIRRFSIQVRDEHDRYVGRLYIFEDITERKRMEETLRESEARFRAIFEGSIIGIGLDDLEGRPLEINPALQKMLGYSAEELRSMMFTKITHPDDVAADWDQFRELVEGKQDAYRLEKRYIRKDGQVVWVHLTVSLVRDERGNPQFVIGMVEDITEHKRVGAELARVQRRLAEIQEAERLHLARELHDSTVQHLLGISYLLGALRRSASAEQHPEAPSDTGLATALDAIHGEVLGVVSQLRGVIGELRPAGLEELGLTVALEGYVARLQREWKQELPEIELDLDKSGTVLPKPVALCLFRSAQEALRNALQHAQADHVTLRLHLLTNEAVLSVCDDGSGFRVPARLSELTQDNHFGLVGMAERVALAGGQLTIHSHPGAGTELTIRVPLGETELSDEQDDSSGAGR